MQNKKEENICDKCGIIFSKKVNLKRHKNKKIPCYNESADMKKPYCINCNRNFSTKQSMLRHVSICNIKKKHQRNQNQIMESLLKKVEILESEIKELKINNTNFNNATESSNINFNNATESSNINFNNATESSNINSNNTNSNNTATITNNITINHYLHPNIEKIKIDGFDGFYQKYKSFTPIELVKEIYYNPDIPENHSIYLVNKKTEEVLTYDGTKWLHAKCKILIPEVQEVCYNAVNNSMEKFLSELLTNGNGGEREYARNTKLNLNNMNNFRKRDEEEDYNKVKNILINNRDIVKSKK
jgi:hypothetical protein